MAYPGLSLIMRIPPLHERPSFRFLLVGAFFGALISWGVFLFMYGTLQERQTITIIKQKREIEQLQDQLSIWQNEHESEKPDEEKPQTKELVIQNLDVKIINSDNFKLGYYSTFFIEEAVKKELNNLISQPVEEVYESKELIKRVIENRQYEIDKKIYKIKVREILFHRTLSVQLKVTDVKSSL
jgi:hypothetical protein